MIRSRSGLLNNDVAVFQPQGNGDKPFTQAGPGGAQAVFYPEIGGMVHTEQGGAVPIEELVGCQVQRQANMGAGIFIGEEFVSPALDENLQPPGAFFVGKGLGLAVGNVVQAAQYVTGGGAAIDSGQGKGLRPRVRLAGHRG